MLFDLYIWIPPHSGNYFYIRKVGRIYLDPRPDVGNSKHGHQKPFSHPIKIHTCRLIPTVCRISCLGIPVPPASHWAIPAPYIRPWIETDRGSQQLQGTGIRATGTRGHSPFAVLTDNPGSSTHVVKREHIRLRLGSLFTNVMGRRPIELAERHAHGLWLSFTI